MQTFGVAPGTNLSAVEPYEMLQPETRKSMTTISPSTQLVCSIAPVNLIVWQARLYLPGGTPGDFKLQWVVPSIPVSGGVLSIQGGATPAGYGVSTGYNTDIVLSSFASAVDVLVVLFYGWFVNGATPGEFGLSWAQNSSNATISSMAAGCVLEILRR